MAIKSECTFIYWLKCAKFLKMTPRRNERRANASLLAHKIDRAGNETFTLAAFAPLSVIALSASCYKQVMPSTKYAENVSLVNVILHVGKTNVLSIL